LFILWSLTLLPPALGARATGASVEECAVLCGADWRGSKKRGSRAKEKNATDGNEESNRAGRRTISNWLRVVVR